MENTMISNEVYTFFSGKTYDELNEMTFKQLYAASQKQFPNTSRMAKHDFIVLVMSAVAPATEYLPSTEEAELVLEVLEVSNEVLEVVEEVLASSNEVAEAPAKKNAATAGITLIVLLMFACYQLATAIWQVGLATWHSVMSLKKVFSDMRQLLVTPSIIV
jgi:hypothetical protein